MLDLFHATFSAVNIIPAILLTFVLVYWLMVILGALDINSFDLDVDTDIDLDFDADFDADVDTDMGTSDVSVAWINNVLSFFNIDKIPLMIFLTFTAIPLWALSVMVNHLLGNNSFLLALLLLIPEFIVSVLIAKPLTYPFVKIFSKLNEPTEQSTDLLGKTGTAVIGATKLKMGQADVNIDGSSYRLNIKTRKGRVNRGDSLLVVNYSKTGKYYIVEPYETIQ